jgi:hypothetical protein
MTEWERNRNEKMYVSTDRYITGPVVYPFLGSTQFRGWPFKLSVRAGCHPFDEDGRVQLPQDDLRSDHTSARGSLVPLLMDIRII